MNLDLYNFHTHTSTIQSGSYANVSPQPFCSSTMSSNLCHSWNDGSCCWPFGQCHYRHCCEECEGDHPDINVLFRHPGHIYFSFSHTVLGWFSSYLTGRIQSVTIGNTTSSSQRLEFGVPQGLMIGPLLFTLHTAPIQNMISAHNLDCMFYADDYQLYITIDPLDQCPALNTLQKCISEVIEWNTIN